MTTLLALDSSTHSCSVALTVDGQLFNRIVTEPREHARRLLPMVDEILVESGIQLADVDALCFTRGPGSFTGLRIGFGVVQGLAFGAGLPVIGVSTLEVLARKAAALDGLTSGTVMPVLDARMGEVYWGLYQIDGKDDCIAVITDKVCSPDAVAFGNNIPPNLLAGEGVSLLGEAFSGIDRDPTISPDAVYTLEAAKALYLRGGAHAVETVSLSYIRNEVTWKKHQKIRGPGKSD